MKVEVRLLATLARFLPPGSPHDGAVLELSPGATVGDVLRALGIPAEIESLRLVNGLDAGQEQALADGDVLTVCPPLAGG